MNDQPVLSVAPVERRAEASQGDVGGGHVPQVRQDGERLSLSLDDGADQRWTLTGQGASSVLKMERSPGGPERDRICALAALEAAFAMAGDPPDLAVEIEEEELRNRLWRDGALWQDGASQWRASASALYQIPDLWLRPPGRPGGVYPECRIMTDGRYHPRRPPVREGIVYARRIPWLGKTLSLRLLDIERDLALYHRWQNDPRIARFWLEEGDLDYHRTYLQGLLADPHTAPLIASLDDRPFGYFEVYWAKENRLGPHYDADDYDRGWHVLIGEEDVRGRDYITAWMPSIVHYILLSDPRTRRVVGEPAADHHQQIRNLDRGGFAKVKEFDFPHKRALLVSLSRERFFAERLWIPRI
ncbi:GNAT family N-acetyltransferase [Novosphingobium beihaiensis]|uniref:Acetyltransferase n=1 Tax=Novosphingobium beihaiensis TaxID=2930389 RepID=A0ABT0BTC1_9SPHN|nr:GNAT family N-acetyltransferase [Novosphingobium beihaiensis]MCJ2188289.1 acetyltransferase [Novosphingobium beihaiensis]